MASVRFRDYKHTRTLLLVTGNILHCVSDTSGKIKAQIECYSLKRHLFLSRYFGTLCGSTVLQAYLLQFGISKSVAFWTVIGLGALVNYVVLTSLNAVANTKIRDGSDTMIGDHRPTGNRLRQISGHGAREDARKRPRK